jgi:hypothetical protein
MHRTRIVERSVSAGFVTPALSTLPASDSSVGVIPSLRSMTAGTTCEAIDLAALVFCFIAHL